MKIPYSLEQGIFSEEASPTSMVDVLEANATSEGDYDVWFAINGKSSKSAKILVTKVAYRIYCDDHKFAKVSVVGYDEAGGQTSYSSETTSLLSYRANPIVPGSIIDSAYDVYCSSGETAAG